MFFGKQTCAHVVGPAGMVVRVFDCALLFANGESLELALMNIGSTRTKATMTQC